MSAGIFKENLLVGLLPTRIYDTLINTATLLTVSARLHKGFNNLRTGPLKYERKVTRM
jgi:hypothetical protein